MGAVLVRTPAVAATRDCTATRLLAGLGSDSSETTAAVLVIEPGRVGRMSRAMEAPAPADMGPRSQSSSLLLRVQAPWLGVAEMKVTPGGMTLVSCTLLAALRP